MIITLCGSARFENEFKHINKVLSLYGHTVIGLSSYPSENDGKKDWYTPEEKERLDLIHFIKIFRSDAIFVIDVDGYVGFSTKREIELATMLGKPVNYLSKGNLKLFDMFLLSH